MIKIEELTNEELSIAVAARVMEWKIIRFEDGLIIAQTGSGELVDEKILANTEWKRDITCLWSPSTNIAHAFQVDKPWWEWSCIELHHIGSLAVKIWTDRGARGWLATVVIPLDPANKNAAYCRGRCITALKACGVEEA